MSTDNRTLLNDCSAAFTGGDDVGSVTTLAGLFYETSALSVQFTNTDERTYTTNIGGTRNLSDATCYMIVKDNLVQTQALGGVKYVLFDGTNEIGYEIGGNNNVGIPLTPFFNGYKFDVSNSAAFNPHVFAGSEAGLSKTAITGVGYGTNHLAKAQGSIDNCFLDQFYFMANGSPALTINGGTVGVPIDLTQVSADDITNGWGLVSNPQGNQFNIFCPTEWGDSGTADSYFEQADSQITLIGEGIGVGNFDMSLAANGTGVNSFVLDNCTLINIGAAANWTLNTTNQNIMKLDGVQYIDGGTFLLPLFDATNKWVKNTSFINCGLVNPSTVTFENITFNGASDPNGAMLITSATTNQSNVKFISDGTGHAIYITTTGTYDFDNFTYSGYGADDTTDAVIYNNSGGAVTINVTGGNVPTVRNGTGASTTVNATVTVTFAKMKDNTEVRVFLAGTTTEIAGIEDAIVGTIDNRSFAWAYAAGTSVDYQLISTEYKILRVEGYVVPSTNTTIDIQQQEDLNY